ncbi:MAG: site-specific DNA-methyltransferase [Candidatus Lokiarchaeota archaeon]|nr:site-specific DNA-methyltransferase [Candidatus Lokiarchaeota archaeon]
MRTSHVVHIQTAYAMAGVSDESIHLVVTSPPYPMIEMWDAAFASQNPAIREALAAADGIRAFTLMHEELDKAWREVRRVLVPGGIACINIGDATRTIGKDFQLYPSHARIVAAFSGLGFQSLPEILWRKQTNAPTKFMGSGMLPAGAYVTLEHEYILIFRKGGKRDFKGGDAEDRRRRSAFFWEERNSWFSDVWEFKGTSQAMASGAARDRNAAFPFELAHRLVNMYSLQEDTVLDPFAGTGTAMLAAMASGRNSVGFEIDAGLKAAIEARVGQLLPLAKELIDKRLCAHAEFMKQHVARGKEAKYKNDHHGFPVVTNQETGLVIPQLRGITRTGDCAFDVTY